MVPIGSYYLGASSTTPSSAAFGHPQSMSQASLPFPTSPPSNNPAGGSTPSYRASMPAPTRGGSTPGISPNTTSAFINQPSSAGRPPQSRFEPTLEEGSDDPGLQRVQLERASAVGGVTSVDSKRKSRGIINPEFKFPPSSPPTSPAASYTAPGPGVPHSGASPAIIQHDLQRRGSPPTVIEDQSSLEGDRKRDDEASSRPAVITPSSIEVPAPPLVEKERTTTRASLDDSADDDVGDTVDIPLN